MSSRDHREGHWSERAAIAIAALQRFGLTRQQQDVVVNVVGDHGNHCYLNYKKMAAELPIRRRNGRRPHYESVGRTVRELTKMGFFTNERFYPGQTPPKADHPQAHGTTLKRFNWDAVGIGGKRVFAIVKRVARVHASILSEQGVAAERRRRRPFNAGAAERDTPRRDDVQRVSLTPPALPAPTSLDDELVAMAAEALEAQEKRARARQHAEHVGTKHASPVLGALAATSGVDPPD